MTVRAKLCPLCKEPMAQCTCDAKARKSKRNANAAIPARTLTHQTKPLLTR